MKTETDTGKMLLWLCAACSLSAPFLHAQDVIVRHDGTTVDARLTAIETEFVKYRKYAYLQGPTFVLRKSDIRMICFENGQKTLFDVYPVPEAPPPVAQATAADTTAVEDYRFDTPDFTLSIQAPSDALSGPDDEYVQCCIGMAYTEIGNPEEAVKWYLKAAEQGSPDAMMCMALVYDMGLGVTKDPEQAEAWRSKAEKQNVAQTAGAEAQKNPPVEKAPDSPVGRLWPHSSSLLKLYGYPEKIMTPAGR